MTDYMLAKKAHNWLYRGVSAASIKVNLGENAIELVRTILPVHKNTAHLYDAETVEALIRDNMYPR